MINKLKELLESSTPGPWFSDGSTFHEGDCQSQHRHEYSYPGAHCNCDTASKESAQLIVAMRNCLPELLAVVEAAQDATEQSLLMNDGKWALTDQSLHGPIDKMFVALAALEKKVGE